MIKFEETKAKCEIEYYKYIMKPIAIVLTISLVLITILFTCDLPIGAVVTIVMTLSATGSFLFSCALVIMYEFCKVLRGN